MQAAQALRTVLVARALIVISSIGFAAVHAVLEDDWASFGKAYLGADFLLSLFAAFDMLRNGFSPFFIHLVFAAAWIAGLAAVLPVIDGRLALL
ncbi:MAG TPA: hypothetical protein VD929_09790 [Caulobacteraceae bacterium]|nr:hypothetical protein [Caulobacteraceae bacterium]